MNGGSDSRLKTTLITFFPMFIATLSLVTSIYNGYLNSKFVDIIQGNVGRTEYMRTCKEIIDAYFQVKFRAGLIGPPAEAGRAAARTEAQHAVHKLGALGTYLANLRDETIRERYTSLTGEVARLVAEDRPAGADTGEPRFAAADAIFAELNEDCVRSAKNQQMP